LSSLLHARRQPEFRALVAVFWVALLDRSFAEPAKDAGFHGYLYAIECDVRKGR
jgi:hypothetical protein